MAAVNIAKHVKRLAQKRDRLTRQIASKQRELDAVMKQLSVVEAAIQPPKPRAVEAEPVEAAS